MRSLLRATALLVAASCCSAPLAGALLIPETAPEWKVSGWLNGSPGKLSELRGKVVLVEFMQLWCPVSSSFSTPLFGRWDRLYDERDDVVIVSIHSVFEGHDVQTMAQLRDYIAEKKIVHPVGIDAYESSKTKTVPLTMDAYNAEGTPQVAIIDKFGMLRWSHFGRFDPRPVEAFIDRLLLEKAEAVAKKKSGDRSKESKRSSRSSPSSSRGRESTRRPPARGAPPAEEKEEEGPDYSGKYRVTLTQELKSCGDLLPPQTVFADLTVEEDQLLVRFSRRFLGQQDLTLLYDADSGSFETDLTGPATERGAEVNLGLTVSGRFLQGREPPEIEFQFQLEKAGEEESANCSLEGSGSGGKAGG